MPVARHPDPAMSAAACLVALLHMNRRPVPMAMVTDACRTGEGITFASFARGARSYGYGFRQMNLSVKDTRRIGRPLVLRMKDDRCVVAEGWRLGRMRVMDPTQGYRKLTKRQMQSEFGGISYEIREDPSRMLVPKPTE